MTETPATRIAAALTALLEAVAKVEALAPSLADPKTPLGVELAVDAVADAIELTALEVHHQLARAARFAQAPERVAHPFI